MPQPYLEMCRLHGAQPIEVEVSSHRLTHIVTRLKQNHFPKTSNAGQVVGQVQLHDFRKKVADLRVHQQSLIKATDQSVQIISMADVGLLRWGFHAQK